MGRVAKGILAARNYHFTPAAKITTDDYIAARKAQLHFANARSIRILLDRIRLRRANRLFSASGHVDVDAVSTTDEDICVCRVFLGGLAHEREAAT